MKETKFKQTDIGLIPEDWVSLFFGNIGPVKMCKRVMKYQTSERGDVPFYKIGTFGKEPDAFISRELYKELKEKYSYPKKGDVLISAAGTIGRTVLFDGKDAFFQDSNIVWLENDECLVINPYLFYLYQVVEWKTENGGIVSRLYNDNFKVTPIAFPPTIEEQERIANALSQVDDLLAALDEQIEKKKLIKQGSMQQLLTGKIRLQGFSGKWKTVKLGKIGNTFNGLTGKAASDFGIGNAQYITFLNVLNNPIIDTSILEKVNVNLGEKQNAVHKGDLFFNTSSETPEEVGICAVILEEIDDLYLNSFCFGFRLFDENVDGKYLAYYFRSKAGRDLMSTLAQGATRYNLSKSAFDKSEIIIPPTKEEQQAIANILSTMDEEIQALQEEHDKYALVKQGMMQQLLTGKIRLN